jgi:hypothetical protein
MESQHDGTSIKLVEDFQQCSGMEYYVRSIPAEEKKGLSEVTH